jgi:hypothetical protein
MTTMTTTTPETTTVHMIGKCPVKGCKTRTRLTLTDQRIVSTRWGKHTECYLTPAAGHEDYARAITPYVQGSEYGLVTPSREAARRDPHRYDVAQLATLRAYRLVCDAHDRFLTVTEIKGIVNVDKTCDGRCMNATGPNCECSCGGENHGGSWAL